MSGLQLVNRLIAAETELGSQKIKSGRLEAWEWAMLHTKIAKLSIHPFYRRHPGSLHLRTEGQMPPPENATRHSGVVVDYLQLMTTGMDNRSSREQEVSTISRS